MPTREDYTRKVIELLADCNAYSLDAARVSWWQDSRGQGGMRLTDCGHKQFSRAGLEYWQFDFDPRSRGGWPKPRHLLVLKNHLTAPYFLQIGKKATLVFYGSKEATMFALYGNIDSFVQALKNLG